MRPGLAAASFSIVSLASVTTHAETLGVALRYEAPAACPSRSAFEAAVHRFSSRVTFAPDDSSSRVLAVRVMARGTELVGEVRLGTKSERADGRTCSEVTDALALISALAIDPAARIPTPVAPALVSVSPAPPPPVPPAMPPEIVPVLHTPAPPSPAEPAQPAEAAELPPEDQTTRHTERALDWRFSAEARGSLRTGIAPVTMLGTTLGANLRSTRTSGFAPVLGAAVAYATSGPLDGASPDATYKLIAGQLSACPLPLARLSSLSIYPCVAMDLGVIPASGESSTVTHLGQAAPFWADIAVTLRGTIDLGGPLFLALDVGGAFSLVQPSFDFDAPVRPVSSVAGFGFVSSLGLGVTFW